MAALFVCSNLSVSKSIWTMAASGLAAVSTPQQIVLSENVQSVLDVVVEVWYQSFSRR
jgi:hypothetical protein